MPSHDPGPDPTVAKERKPTEEERFAETHPEGVVNA
jgi:hypothetical protein